MLNNYLQTSPEHSLLQVNELFVTLGNVLSEHAPDTHAVDFRDTLIDPLLKAGLPLGQQVAQLVTSDANQVDLFNDLTK